MKTVYIIRHAKSSWATPGQVDFDRPLNERGKENATMMAERLKDKHIKIDAFVSSPAKRAKKTCKAFCKVYNKNEAEIIIKEELYHAPMHTYYKVISSADNSFNQLAVFGHNPGISDFVNTLVANVAVGDMPTCAVFAVTAETDDWMNFEITPKNFLFFDFPKNEIQ